MATAYNLTDTSDSDNDDDDDDLFNSTQSLFQKPSRAETKKKAQRQHLLDAALQDAEDNFATQLRIQQLRIEHQIDGSGDDDDDADVPNYQEVLAAAANKNKSQLELEQDEGVFDSETQTLREKALQHDMVERSGRRHTIRFRPAAGYQDNKFFASKAQAVEELQHIVQRLPQNDVSKLQEKLQFAIDYDLVDDLLVAFQWPVQRRDSAILMSPQSEFTVWLWAVAGSAGLWERHWGDAARRALEKLLIVTPDYGTNVTLNDFLSLLQCWDANHRLSKSNQNDDDVEMKDDTESHDPVVKNIDGLINCLLLWESIVSSCPLDQPTAHQCLQLLVRLSLDVDLNRRDVVSRVMTALLANLESAAAVAPFLMPEGLTKLGPGLTDEDAEDSGAWLVLTEAVRLPPLYSPTATSAVLALRASLAQNASEICLEQDSFQNQMQRLTSEHPSLATLVQDDVCKSLANVCAGLEALLQLSDAEIGRDPPRVQASVECLFAMFGSAMLILERQHKDKNGASPTTTTTTTLANVERDFFALLDPMLMSLSHRFRPMVTTSHIRRSDMLLHLWHQYNIVMHRQASVTQQQKTMDSFFKPMTPSPTKQQSTSASSSSLSPMRT